MKKQISAKSRKNKKLILSLLAVTLLSASCNLGGGGLPAGIAKSLNGGVDWQYINKIKDQTEVNLNGLSVSKLAFDPQNNSVVFAGSYNDGLFKSEDAGANWVHILSKIYVYDFAVNNQDPRIIYAAGMYNKHGLVLKTTDGGGSWNQIYNEEGENNPVRTIALNPTNPNQLLIGTATGSLIKSSDSGLSWQLVKNFNDRINRVIMQGQSVYVLLRTKGLHTFSGGVDNFTDITSSLTKAAGFDFTYISSNAVQIGTFNQVYIDTTASNLMYITTDKGLYKSVDGGKTWGPIKLPIQPELADTRAVNVAKSSSNIVYTSIGSTVYKSLDGGNSWQTQRIDSGGFINYILVDPNLPQVVYAGIYIAQ